MARGRVSTEAYLLAFMVAMPTEKWVQTLKNYAEEAEGGDEKAIKFFASYLVGMPVKRVQTEMKDRREVLDAFEEALHRVFPNA